MHRAAFLALTALAACGTVAERESRASDPLPLVEAGAGAPAVRALFEGYPEPLFVAAGLACDGPGQSMVQDTRDSLRCESLPTPQDAAALILEYDGTIEDLPRYVISFEGEQSAQGYLVTADSYIRVPGQGGETRLLKPQGEEARALLTDILRAAGGNPV